MHIYGLLNKLCCVHQKIDIEERIEERIMKTTKMFIDYKSFGGNEVPHIDEFLIR